MAYAGLARETKLVRSELIVPIDAAAPPSSNSLKKPSLEERATKFVSSQIAGWSSTRIVESTHADNVFYYGSRKSRKAILLQKSRALEGWPERVYDRAKFLTAYSPPLMVRQYRGGGGVRPVQIPGPR